MNVLYLDFTEIELRTLSLFPKLADMEHKADMYSHLRRGKSKITQRYMEHVYNDLMRQGRTVLTATRAKLSHITLDEIQQPMKRVGQPLTLDDFRKSALSIQLTMALSKDVV